MEAQVTTMLRAYLVENGIDERAALRITAHDILVNVRDQERELIQQGVAVAVAGDGPAPSVLAVEASIPVDKPSTVPSTAEPAASPTGAPKRKRDDEDDDDDEDPVRLPTKRRKQRAALDPKEEDDSILHPRPLSQIAALHPSSDRACCHDPPATYHEFLSRHLVYISLRFASVCVFLMRRKRVGDALAIGRYAVDFLGPDIWFVLALICREMPISSDVLTFSFFLCFPRRLAVRYFEAHEADEAETTAGARACLSDALEQISAFDRSLGRRLHRVMAETAMHRKKSLNMQG